MFTLRKIKAEDNLAQLFNRYMKGLSTLEIMSEPTYVTMREVYEGFRGSRRQKNKMAQEARRFYELHVLSGSLRGIHHSVLGAIKTLEEFFGKYNGDLMQYAIQKRIESLDEHGGGDDSDWRRDGVDEEGEEKWAVVYKDNPEALEGYHLLTDLLYYFGSDTRGEHIGSSASEHFWRFTTCVEHESDFSFRKMMEAFTSRPVEIVRVQEDGQMEPMGLADHIEDEMNQDIRNAALAEQFTMVIDSSHMLGWYVATMDANTTAPIYEALLKVLIAIRDVDTAMIGPAAA
jgi:hypothetical protein